MVFASRASNDWRFWRAFALVVALCLFALGCGKGSSGGTDSGGPVSGVPLTDLHGDIPLNATRIIVDGPKIVGAINPKPPDPITGGGDIDFFVFTGVQGTTYCLQISGYESPVPSLNGTGAHNLRVQIIRSDQATQLLNTTGTDGGEPYDTDPSGINVLADFITLGDSRIIWLPPLTNDYFIKIQHALPIVGTGNYVFSVASTQIADTFGPLDMPQTDGRLRFNFHNIFILDDMGVVAFNGAALGVVGFNSYRLTLEGGGNEDAVVFFIVRPVVLDLVVASFDPDIDVPDTAQLHFHVGTPSAFNPRDNLIFVDGDDPHPFFLSLDIPLVPLRAKVSEDEDRQLVQLETPDGHVVSAPLDFALNQFIDINGQNAKLARGTANVSEALDSRGTGEITTTFNDLRTIAGFDWYVDLHWTTDLDLDSRPTTSSPAFGDVYTLFETSLRMNFNEVVNRETDELPEILRGIGDGDLPFFYDSSLHAFQVVDQFYNPLDGTFTSGHFDAFAGMAVSVHRGGPGQIGPRIIDLGTMPAPEIEPDFKFTPGIRNVIKQLSDEEVEILRDAFYGDGFYVQISNPQFPNGLIRAQGFLDIQTFPLDGTVRSPGALVPKGTVNFATEYAVGGGVTVISNGKLLGVLDEFIEVGSDPPDCGLTASAGVLGAEYWPGEYYYRAFSDDGAEWEGHFEVGSGTCETIILSLE